ncbi:MAG: hypothetical protein KDA20_05320 [Phycisphaerales bacterium]|nr:hypothetical protein [Phycisphaerales bacterium]
MAIQKQEFYEGAALHRLVRGGELATLKSEPPFFLVNDRLLIHLKYCTKTRTPWGFTFLPEEQRTLAERAENEEIVIGLVCGGDGVAALPVEEYLLVAPVQDLSLRIACRRRHGEHYAVSGPAGELSKKVAPSAWQRLLNGSS